MKWGCAGPGYESFERYDSPELVITGNDETNDWRTMIRTVGENPPGQAVTIERNRHSVFGENGHTVTLKQGNVLRVVVSYVDGDAELELALERIGMKPTFEKPTPWICWTCKKEVARDARSCPHCGDVFQEVEVE